MRFNRLFFDRIYPAYSGRLFNLVNQNTYPVFEKIYYYMFE